jgi:hypothetical protein
MKRVDRIEASTVDIQMERQRNFSGKDFKDLDSDTRQALAFQTETVSGAIALSGRYYARALRSYNTAYRILRELQRERLKGEAVESTVAPVANPREPSPAVEPDPVEAPRPVKLHPRLLLLPSEPENNADLPHETSRLNPAPDDGHLSIEC